MAALGYPSAGGQRASAAPTRASQALYVWQAFRHTEAMEYESVMLVVLHGLYGKRAKPNPSVNRTSTSGLRPLAAAGYLKR